MFLWLIFAIVIFFFTANLVYVNSGYFKEINSQFLKFKMLSKQVDIVNIGSFPSIYCFDWDSVSDVRGFNLGVGPEEIYYDNRMLQFYCKKAKVDKLIVLHVITPLLFCENKYTYEIPYNIRYSIILPKKDVRVPEWMYYLEKFFPLGRKMTTAFFYRIIRLLCHSNNVAIDSSTPKDQADAMIKGWIEQNPDLNDLMNADQSQAMKLYFEYQKNALKEMLHFCKENNLTYVPVIGPVSEYIRSFISDEFFETFVVKNLIDAGIKKEDILNYYDNRNYSSMENYSNGLFLNSYSRKHFTNDVVEELARRNII